MSPKELLSLNIRTINIDAQKKSLYVPLVFHRKMSKRNPGLAFELINQDTAMYPMSPPAPCLGINETINPNVIRFKTIGASNLTTIDKVT